MRCLVTGHMGYIGSKVYKKLLSLGHDVDGIDIKSGKNVLYDLDSLTHERYDYIFHLAAFPRVEYSVQNPSATMENNVLSTSKILEFAKEKSVKRVIFSSSSAVIGDNGTPNSPYGLQKLISEMECDLYSKLYGVDTVCLRYFNVYSEDQPSDGPYSTIIAAWMEKLKNSQPLRIDGDGEQKRDFVHVDDVVDSNIFFMNMDTNLKDRRVYDIGTGKAVSVNFIKQYIKKYFNKVQFVNAPARPGDVLQTLADIKPMAALGWTASVDVNAGLARCFG